MRAKTPKKRLTAQQRGRLYERYWAHIEPDREGYSDAIARLLKLLPDQDLIEAVHAQAGED